MTPRPQKWAELANNAEKRFKTFTSGQYSGGGRGGGGGEEEGGAAVTYLIGSFGGSRGSFKAHSGSLATKTAYLRQKLSKIVPKKALSVLEEDLTAVTLLTNHSLFM